MEEGNGGSENTLVIPVFHTSVTLAPTPSAVSIITLVNTSTEPVANTSMDFSSNITEASADDVSVTSSPANSKEKGAGAKRKRSRGVFSSKKRRSCNQKVASTNAVMVNTLVCATGADAAETVDIANEGASAIDTTLVSPPAKVRKPRMSASARKEEHLRRMSLQEIAGNLSLNSIESLTMRRSKAKEASALKSIKRMTHDNVCKDTVQRLSSMSANKSSPYSLEVFETSSRGRCVRTNEIIPKGRGAMAVTTVCILNNQPKNMRWLWRGPKRAKESSRVHV
jgi:hypothetical protein